MHARLRGPSNLLILHQILIEPDFPCLADEIAKQRPGINIKVTAFTVSEKSVNITIKGKIMHCKSLTALMGPGIVGDMVELRTSSFKFS